MSTSPVTHEFEDDMTGDEITLNPEVTYRITSSWADIVDGELVFTHRVKPAPMQFEAETDPVTGEITGDIKVFDDRLPDSPGDWFPTPPGDPGPPQA